jgi:hypothetical protein
MEYQVPQFIEVEDKIFGPFTFKQFVYLAGGAGLCAIAFAYLPFIFAFIAAAPVAALAGALAFYKVNNKPFIEIVEAGFNYVTGGKLYLWKKDAPKSVTPAESPAPASASTEARAKLGLTRGKLHDLAWSLDVKDANAPQE